MIKHVNFTGRRRIPRRHVQIEVHDGSPRRFDVVINLDGTRMPAGAKVFLEAMCAGSTVVQRFDFGAVGALAPHADRRLTDIEGENVFFALKVIDRSERIGRILGIAENIRPQHAGKQTATGRKGILPIETAPLGQQLWDLHFGEQDVCLRVNEDVPGLKERARYDALFYAAVYPAVVRQILARAVAENADAEEESDRWPVLWLRFAKGLHPDHEAPPSQDSPIEDRDEWIDAVVSAFCSQHGLKDAFVQHTPSENGGDA